MLALAPSPAPMPFAPPGTYFVDALSAGNEAGNGYTYSVSPGSVGLAGSPLAMETFVGTAPSQMIPFPGVPGPPAPPEQMGDLFYRGTNFATGMALPTFGIPLHHNLWSHRLWVRHCLARFDWFTLIRQQYSPIALILHVNLSHRANLYF